MKTCRDGIPDDGGGVFFRGDPPVDHGIADGLAAGVVLGHITLFIAPF
jgi:hypothetical protein